MDKIVHKFNCLVCQVFVHESRMGVKHHVENEHAMYTCRNAHCVAGFKTAQGRDLHSSVHIKKTRICTRCNQLFSHRYALEHHMVVHAKVKKH